MVRLEPIELADVLRSPAVVSSVVVSVLHSLRFSLRSRALLHLEILALRHQLAIVHLTSADRMLWAWLSQRWRG